MTERLQKFKEWARACMHVRCGFCRDNCPAYSQLQLDSYAAKGKMTMLHHWLNGRLTPDDVMAERVFACTGCGLCDVACGYPQSEAIQEMKMALIEQEIHPPSAYAKVSDKTQEFGNPYGEQSAQGTSYLLSIPESGRAEADYTLFLGCTQIYREEEEIETLLKILRAADVSFNVIQENICCGSPAYRTGDLQVAKAQAERVLEKLQGNSSTNIVVSCAGCYSMFTNIYPTLLTTEEPGPSYIHTMDILAGVIEKKRLALQELPVRITYHDACHLGRHSDIYDQPRRILKAIPGVDLVEMEWNRKFSKCCGAGGGFRSGSAVAAVAIAAERIRDAEAIGAQILATACPFCLRNLREGAESIESGIDVRSVESLVAEVVRFG